MAQLLPDDSFYPSARMAMEATPEKLAYVAMLNENASSPDAIAVVDVDRASKTYATIVNRIDMPNA